MKCNTILSHVLLSTFLHAKSKRQIKGRDMLYSRSSNHLFPSFPHVSFSPALLAKSSCAAELRHTRSLFVFLFFKYPKILRRGLCERSLLVTVGNAGPLLHPDRNSSRSGEKISLLHVGWRMVRSPVTIGRDFHHSDRGESLGFLGGLSARARRVRIPQSSFPPQLE